MAFPPPVLNANVGGAISDPNEHPGHHNALAAAVNDIVEHVSTMSPAMGSMVVLEYDAETGWPSRAGVASGVVVLWVNRVDDTDPSGQLADVDILVKRVGV
jgi:hypothetical protein